MAETKSSLMQTGSKSFYKVGKILVQAFTIIDSDLFVNLNKLSYHQPSFSF